MSPIEQVWHFMVPGMIVGIIIVGLLGAIR